MSSPRGASSFFSTSLNCGWSWVSWTAGWRLWDEWRTSSMKRIKWWNEVLRWAACRGEDLGVSELVLDALGTTLTSASLRRTFNTERTHLRKVVVVQVRIDAEQASHDRLDCRLEGLGERDA